MDDFKKYFWKDRQPDNIGEMYMAYYEKITKERQTHQEEEKQ